MAAVGQLDIVECPQCAAPAEVVDRFAMRSTGGPVEHLKVQGVDRHWFVMEADHVTRGPSTARTQQCPTLFS